MVEHRRVPPGRAAVIAALLIGGLVVGWAAAALSAPVYLDVCLSMTGTNAQARAALRVLGLDKEMLVDISEGGPPNEVIVGYNHHVAIDIMPVGSVIEYGPPLVLAAVPIMRIRFISDEARAKARTNIVDAGGLPAGLAKVPCPTTRIWAGD